jgi:adenosylcobinamide-GDP ribazoletransferase
MKKLFNSFFFGLQFLTRIPVPAYITPDATTAGNALIFFPLLGFLIGSLLFGVWRLLIACGIDNTFTGAVIIIAVETIVTGAFHLDGLADSFDALLSPGTDREKKLSIMKDSRIGVMGGTSLIITLLLKTALLSELLDNSMASVLIIYPAAGRWVQVALYTFSPYVRKDGIGLIFSKNAGPKTLFFATLWFIPCCIFISFSLIYIFLLIIIFLYLYRLYVHKSIGGITGDILGSATVLSELVFLIGSLFFRI